MITLFKRYETMKKNNTFTLRLNEDIAKKFAYVCQKEGLSINNQLVGMIRQKISYFERVKGNIPKGALDNVNMSDFQEENA